MTENSTESSTPVQDVVMPASDSVQIPTIRKDEPLERVVEIGLFLIQVKRQSKHGEWLPWLKAHFAGNKRTAQLYMRIARVFQGKHLERHKHLTVDEAQELILGRRFVDDRGKGKQSEIASA